MRQTGNGEDTAGTIGVYSPGIHDAPAARFVQLQVFNYLIHGLSSLSLPTPTHASPQAL